MYTVHLYSVHSLSMIYFFLYSVYRLSRSVIYFMWSTYLKGTSTNVGPTNDGWYKPNTYKRRTVESSEFVTRTPFWFVVYSVLYLQDATLFSYV